MATAMPSSPAMADLQTTRMVVGGAALARDADGRVVFVDGALPGETVRVSIRTQKKDFATAEVIEVLSPSADRVEPPCEAWHRGCGGCDWQHIASEAQLALKVDIVGEALTRTGRLVEPIVIAGGSVAPWGYRTTIRVAPTTDGQFGFRSRRSHDVVPITSCPISDDRVNALLSLVVGGDIDGDDEMTLRVGAPNVDAADGADDSTSGVIEEIVAGRRFRVSPASFFQSSAEAAELLVAAVGRQARGVDIAQATVIDAYGGVGLFAATVAADARHIELVESSRSACADARVNLADLPATIVHARMEHWRPPKADLVIADPSRSGLGKVASARLASSAAAVVILVSCDAGSLGRDARLLHELGYRHDATEVIDVFPQTSHIEAVTRFVRESDAPHAE